MKQKDQFPSKCESVIIKNFRDLTAMNGKHAPMVDSTTGFKKLDDKTKQTEESFRTVMYLSSWGLN